MELYEKRKRTISADLLKNICIFLNISADELLDLKINNSYNPLNSENTKILKKIKDTLLFSQRNK